MSKIDKEIIAETQACLADASPEIKKNWLALLKSMQVTATEDSPAASPDGDEDSPDSPVEKKKSGKKSSKKDSPDSPDDDEDSPDSPEDDSPDSPEDDSPDSPDSPDDDEDSPDSPVEKKSSKKTAVKVSSKKKEADADEDEDAGVDFNAMNEKKLVTFLTDEGVDPSVFKAIRKDKKKLVKLAKAYQAQVDEFAAMKLVKLEKLKDKNELKVSYGRGRSSDEKKVGILAKALAAHGLTA